MILEVLDKILGVCGVGTKTVYMSAEFGLPPGAIYRDELAAFSDLELIRMDRTEVLAEVRRMRAEGRLTRVRRELPAADGMMRR